MAADIPTVSRDRVRRRDEGQCLRCGLRGHDPHHRRRRNVVDAHQHCPCNLITLCRLCHNWAHGHPEEARSLGFIVSITTRNPGSELIEAFYGTVLLTCEGGTERSNS